jgi:hypothetical protein
MLGCQKFKEFLSLKACQPPSLKPTKLITPSWLYLNLGNSKFRVLLSNYGLSRNDIGR